LTTLSGTTPPSDTIIRRSPSGRGESARLSGNNVNHCQAGRDVCGRLPPAIPLAAFPIAHSRCRGEHLPFISFEPDYLATLKSFSYRSDWIGCIACTDLTIYIDQNEDSGSAALPLFGFGQAKFGPTPRSFDSAIKADRPDCDDLAGQTEGAGHAGRLKRRRDWRLAKVEQGRRMGDKPQWRRRRVLVQPDAEFAQAA
jgi:hypothetical protein